MLKVCQPISQPPQALVNTASLANRLKDQSKKPEVEHNLWIHSTLYIQTSGTRRCTDSRRNHYIINFIDDHSDMLWLYLSRKKWCHTSIQRMVSPGWERELAILLNAIRTDNGASSLKYLRNAPLTHRCQTWVTATNIHHPKMGNLNSVIEPSWPCKSNKIIFNIPPNCGASVFLHQYVKNWTLGSDPKLKHHMKVHKNETWHITYERTRMPSMVLKRLTIPRFYDHSIECVLIRYAPNSKAYQCYNRLTGHIHTSRNVTFIDSQDNVDDPWDRIQLSPKTKKLEMTRTPQCTRTEENCTTKDNTTAKTPERDSPTMFIPNKSTNMTGAALKGLPYVSRMDRVMQEVRETTERVRQSRQQNEAHNILRWQTLDTLAPEDDDDNAC